VEDQARQAAVNGGPRVRPVEARQPRLGQETGRQQRRRRKDQGGADPLEPAAPPRRLGHQVQAEGEVQQGGKQQGDVRRAEQHPGGVVEAAQVVVAQVHVLPARQEGGQADEADDQVEAPHG
jgi:hypothetical protein